MALFHDLLLLRALEEPAMHPREALVAVTVADVFTRPHEGRQSRIWLVAGDGERRAITTGPGGDRLPRWSPDGSLLVFLSDRGTPGLHRLFTWSEQDGERAIPAAIDGAVEDAQWAADGRRLLVLAADAGSDRPGTQAATRIEGTNENGDPFVQRPGDAWRRLYVVDAASGEAHELTRPGRTAWEAHWYGAARVAAVTSADPTESGWYDPTLDIVNAETGEARAVYTPRDQLQTPRVSPDGRYVVAVEAASSDRATLAGRPVIVDVESGAALPVEGVEDAAFLEWRDGASLWFAAWQGLGTRFGVIHVDGRVEEWWSGAMTLGSRYTLRLSAGAAGLAAVVEDPAHPPEVALFDRGAGEWRCISDFNTAIAALPLPTAEAVAWPAGDGQTIEGLLVRPIDTAPRPGPLIMIVHGGPNLLWSQQFTNNTRALALAAGGYHVLLPNPRGSIGRGLAFARAVLGDCGGADLQDLLAGVDAMVARGIADTERIGITGVSYGGFMSAWAVTQTRRFAASIPLSCVSNQLSHYYSANIRRFDELWVGASPREDAAAYLACSPVQFVDGATTPTLLISGDGDHITPPGQAIEMYQALVEVGCPTELVIYPREGHYVLEWEHQHDFFARILGWFDRWLRDRPG